MKDHGPCCTTLRAEGTLTWEAALAAALAAPPVPQVPPQLDDGMSSLMDIGTNTPKDIGRVFTTVNNTVNPPLWTEHWVVKPAGWFSDTTRHSRLQFANPQPAKLPWNQEANNWSGYWHAAVTYSYVALPPASHTPAAGTFVFDVRNNAGPTRGRLFRTAVGNNIQDRWVLYSTYVKPQGATTTELHPNGGNAQTLWTNALANAGGGEYVEVGYTVAQLP